MPWRPWLKHIHTIALWYWNRNVQGEWRQRHDHWCPGSLRRQDINNQVIGYAKQNTGADLNYIRISLLRNDKAWKYTSVFPKKICSPDKSKSRQYASLRNERHWHSSRRLVNVVIHGNNKRLHQHFSGILLTLLSNAHHRFMTAHHDKRYLLQMEVKCIMRSQNTDNSTFCSTTGSGKPQIK